MRALLIAVLAAGIGAGHAVAQSQSRSEHTTQTQAKPNPAPRQGPASRAGVTPNRTSTGQPPFGGTFESRLERLGADVDGGVKKGWFTPAQALGFTQRISALSAEVKAVRARNGGKIPDADNRRMQETVTVLHQAMSDVADAAKGKG